MKVIMLIPEGTWCWWQRIWNNDDMKICLVFVIMVKTANSPSCPIPEYLLVSLKVGIQNGCIKNIPASHGFRKYWYYT